MFHLKKSKENLEKNKIQGYKNDQKKIWPHVKLGKIKKIKKIIYIKHTDKNKIEDSKNIVNYFNE